MASKRRSTRAVASGGAASYRNAREQYGELGVDTEAVLRTVAAVPLSLHCWQGDDVAGFEGATTLGGGLAVTGEYPGRARTADELRTDVAWAVERIPGVARFNLHASYAEFSGRRVERDALLPEHFARWIAWAKAEGMGLDFNPTYFAHRMAGVAGTLSHRDPAVRRFWIRHGQACRRIGAAMGQALGTPCVTNVWIPDGSKDQPVDRRGPRERLVASLDEVFAESLPATAVRDAVEPKLFGLGCESYTVGSMEFYLAYAVRRGTMLCLDSGHFHPTESVADKISAVLGFVDRILLHVSRGVRWDSDHVVTWTDDVQAICDELVRGDYLGRTALGLDYFDASINRVAAWVIGARSTRRALLQAFLQPLGRLREAEAAGDFTTRLAWLEEAKSLPASAVWEELCRREEVPASGAWLAELRRYEDRVQRPREGTSRSRRLVR